MTEDRKVAEREVPQSVIDAFERWYSPHFNLERDDHEWRNTWRYKHDHIQSHWAGWRDAYLALCDTALSRRAEPVGMVALSASDQACYQWPGEDEAPLRDAFVQGALYASPSPATGARVNPLVGDRHERAQQIVATIFADLRDRRFLKWLFKEEPGVIGNFHNLTSIDLDVQQDIFDSWVSIVLSALTSSGADPAVETNYADDPTSPEAGAGVVRANK